MVPELVGTIFVLLIKPFSLLKLSCMAGLRGTSVLVNTWVELLSASIYFTATIFWRFVVWTVSLITLPARAVVALRMEKQMHAQLCELQDRLDSLVWDRNKLQEHVQIAIKEHEMLEMILSELEDEHDEALNKIKLLETELETLKDENIRLKEFNGKSQWDTDTDYEHDQIKHKDAAKLSKSKLKSDRYNGGKGKALTDILMHKDGFEVGNKDDLVINKSVYSGDDIVGERMEVALLQSVFSAVLSVLVGMIIWEAEDPCLPLVTALFMVVGMSLKSVVQFFFTIKNRPASDAVALLSLNWFMLGTLTYPTLPMVARLSEPIFTKLLERALGGWFRFWF